MIDSRSYVPDDERWDDGFELLDEIGAAFAGVDLDEDDREVAAALAEVRAEMRAARGSPAVPKDSPPT